VTWQARLIEEHGQLVERLDALRAFIETGGDNITGPLADGAAALNHVLTEEFRSLPEDDQDDLLEQLQHMEAYEAVLARRISRLETDHA
jgi:hypothetical protein